MERNNAKRAPDNGSCGGSFVNCVSYPSGMKERYHFKISGIAHTAHCIAFKGNSLDDAADLREPVLFVSGTYVPRKAKIRHPRFSFFRAGGPPFSFLFFISNSRLMRLSVSFYFFQLELYHAYMYIPREPLIGENC